MVLNQWWVKLLDWCPLAQIRQWSQTVEDSHCILHHRAPTAKKEKKSHAIFT